MLFSGYCVVTALGSEIVYSETPSSDGTSFQSANAIVGGAFVTSLTCAAASRLTRTTNKRPMINLAIALAFVATQSAPISIEAQFDVALGVAGLSTKTARFDEGLLKLYGSGEFTAPFYEALSQNPWRAPFYVGVVRAELASAVEKPSNALMTGTRLLGYGTRRTLLGDPIATFTEAAKAKDALATAISDYKKAGLISGEVPDLTGVPAETQQAAALVLRALLETIPYRRMAFKHVGNIQAAYDFMVKNATNDDVGGEPFNQMLDIAHQTDLSYLAAGGHDLMLACQAAAAITEAVPETAQYDVKVDTVWGQIRLSGAGTTIYTEPSLLVIDTGGKDTYINVPSNTSAKNWASIVIDTKGDDKYISDPLLAVKSIESWDGRKTLTGAPGPGGALFGYSYLIDTDGNDLYRSSRPAIGSGTFGIGMVLDTAGNDAYDAYVNGEGFGYFGAGILEDSSGDDTYDGFNLVQGVGKTAGFGYLVDRKGTDRYSANDHVFDFPSAQSAEHNTSMAQGAGYGRRADYSDGHSWSGGIGILFDGLGDDTYTCGVFGQGTGYWQGVGMLWDTGGTDNYTGQWYVQGAAAHFAIGYIEDTAGSDTYVAKMNMALGAGHDFSIGYLLDREGDDKYSAPNLSLGAGNANGMGIFADFGGNDKYESTGITLGKGAEADAGGIRSRGLCLGVFLDMAGQDSYPSSCPWAVNGARTANWTTKGLSAPESQLGVFLDE